MTDELVHARDHYARRAWADAHRAFSLADTSSPLSADDLWLFAWSASLVGRIDDFLTLMERLYQAHVAVDHDAPAARCAFWLALRLAGLGQASRAGGWLTRATRLVGEKDCAERGYLSLSNALRHVATGDLEAAAVHAREAAAIGDHFRDTNLCAFARCVYGRTLLGLGDVASGLALLDEVMVAATTGELEQAMTGLIYCSAIAGCRQVYAIDRSREWTEALAGWCAEQPQLVAFGGTCLVHRAELLQLRGAWPDALTEARRASSCEPHALDADTRADSFYQEAEVHRLRGDFADAERAYLGARQAGRDAQPGLALLRLAQGRPADAASAIRATLQATPTGLARARVLPAYVEIMLAADDLPAAKEGCEELERVAAAFGTEVLAIMAAQARGGVELADGRPQAALDPLQRALRGWQQLGAPYLAARVRVDLARTRKALRDVDSAQLELALALEVFKELGAAPDVATLRVSAAAATEPREAAIPFTPRELEVLRELATGKTNKAIARQLFVSEKTIDRHVSNIFQKANVATRAAATAFAYQRGLV